MRMLPCLAMVLLLGLVWTGRVWALAEERFGNEPISAANYTDWPGLATVINDTNRVYYTWVNGNEHAYYKCGPKALGTLLEGFAKVGIPVREVVIRPGPGRTKSFHGKPVAFDAMLHVVGGIARHQTRLDRGFLVWSAHPQLHVFVSETLPLGEIGVPEGVTLIGLETLKARNLEALGSTDTSVRGWGCGNLAYLDKYDERSAAAIARLLDDRDDWVRLNAAGALEMLGASARAALPSLEAARAPDDEALRERIAGAIDAIRGAKADAEAGRAHREALERIEAFLEARSNE